MEHIGDVQGLVLSFDRFDFFLLTFFFFLIWEPCDSFLTNSLHCSHQGHFIFLEIKVSKIHSTFCS